MNTAMSIVKIACLSALCAFLVAGTWAALELRETLAEVRSVAAESRKMITSDAGLKGTLQNVNGVLIQVGIAADQVAQTSIVQKEHWEATARQTTLAMADLRRTVNNLDQSVNRELVPQMNATLRAAETSTTTLTQESVKSLARLTDEAVPAVKSFAQAGEQANRILGDPAILNTLMRTEETAANVERATREAADAVADLRQWVARLTKPGKSVWGVFKLLFGLAAQGAQIAK